MVMLIGRGECVSYVESCLGFWLKILNKILEEFEDYSRRLGGDWSSERFRDLCTVPFKTIIFETPLKKITKYDEIHEQIPQQTFLLDV